MIGGKSGLTRLSLSLFGHRGTDSGVVDLALPERAGCVRHFAREHACNKQTLDGMCAEPSEV